MDVLTEASGSGDLAAILADTGELQTNQAAWATATGFSTHSAADVWTAVTRVLTANTNLNDPTAATIADAVWDEVLTAATHNIATSAGRRLQELGAFSIVSGTAATGTARTITLDSDASTTANIYNENLIVIIGGTGAGQTRMILEYTAGRVATVDRDWHVTPAGDSEYQIVAFSGVLIATNGVAQAGAASTITLATSALDVTNSYIGCGVYITAGTGAGQTRLITAYTSGRVATVSPAWETQPDNTSAYKVLPVGRSIIDSISAEAENLIADAVWDEALESTYTGRQMMRIFTAVLAGLANGGGSTTINFRDIADGKNRVTATVDSDGNRTAITLDGS
jgi:hypothetical protein